MLPCAGEAALHRLLWKPLPASKEYLSSYLISHELKVVLSDLIKERRTPSANWRQCCPSSLPRSRILRTSKHLTARSDHSPIMASPYMQSTTFSTGSQRLQSIPEEVTGTTTPTTIYDPAIPTIRFTNVQTIIEKCNHHLSGDMLIVTGTTPCPIFPIIPFSNLHQASPSPCSSA